jgi:hypothetical protein
MRTVYSPMTWRRSEHYSVRPYSSTAIPYWQHVMVWRPFLWHASIENQSIC